MRRFAIAILVSLPLMTATDFAQDTTSSPAPPSASAPSGAAADSPAPPSTPAGSGPGPSAPFKVCGEKNPSPCATPPRLIKSPVPEYSREARNKKYQGVVVLWLIVGADGLPRDIRVARSLGYGLDEEAIKAVKKWKFKPSTLDGHPVAVQINIEVSFRLY